MGVLDGKVALETGASKAVGVAIAIGLGEAGASIVVNYASRLNGADRTINVIRSHDGNAIGVAGNISKATDVSTLFAETYAVYGRLDV